MITDGLPAWMAQAIWAGDMDTLFERARCQCCCAEHTFTTGCPAYVWGGCRGQYSETPADRDAWVQHYVRFHGMTEAQFFGDYGDRR